MLVCFLPHGFKIAAIPPGITSMFQVGRKEKAKRPHLMQLFLPHPTKEGHPLQTSTYI